MTRGAGKRTAEIAALVDHVESLKREKSDLLNQKRQRAGTVDFEELVSACIDLGEQVRVPA